MCLLEAQPLQSADNYKIRDRLPVWYRELHAEGKFLGASYAPHLKAIQKLVGEDWGKARILDFGCGPLGGLQVSCGSGRVAGYDPYVEAFSVLPWGKGPYDLVFSSDVLEHLLVKDVREFCGNVALEKPRWIYLAISTRPALKTFPNGQNVHLTIEPASWWQGFLQGFWSDYRVVRAHSDLVDGQAVFGFERLQPVA